MTEISLGFYPRLLLAAPQRGLGGGRGGVGRSVAEAGAHRDSAEGRSRCLGGMTTELE